MTNQYTLKRLFFLFAFGLVLASCQKNLIEPESEFPIDTASDTTPLNPGNSQSLTFNSQVERLIAIKTNEIRSSLGRDTLIQTAIGANGNDGNGNDAGHVRIYTYSAGSWTQLGADIDGEAADDNSGAVVSLSSDGTRVAIAARSNDGNGSNAGHVRVYSICFDTIQQQPQSNTFYTVPGDAYFTVIHSDTTATYQWQENTGSGWSNLSDQGVYSGTATDSLILTGITASLNGYEYRCLVDACSMDTTNLATLTVVDNIGIGEVLTDVVVSPNPTSGTLNIVLTSLSEYEVFNINGHRVAQGKTEGQIDITKLPAGSYQIIITNDDGRSTHTIQKI